MKKIKKQLLKPEAVIKSLRCALDEPFDHEKAEQRIKNMLARSPAGSLCITNDRGWISFYKWSNGKKPYLRKKSDQLYQLARKRYLQQLLKVLVLVSDNPYDTSMWDVQFEKLAKLIWDFATGNLNLARIVLTPKQYAWYSRDYPQKAYVPKTSDTSLFNAWGVRVRTKSEQNIGDSLFDFAVTNHYEERMRIKVKPLVDSLKADLTTRSLLDGNLYYYQDGSCHWNVPTELEWMNNHGSVWRSYNPNTGYITLHPDYTIMLADGSLLYWEHEGLLTKFVYRANATERVALMIIAGHIPRVNIIETDESESTNRTILEHIIKTKVLPRFWF